MSTIQDLFEQAQLAEAAYANLFSDTGVLLTNDGDIQAALQDSRNNLNFSITQATDFTNRYQVVSQYTASGGLTGDGSGFSATVFLDPNTGQYTFAVRGTESGNVTDLIGACKKGDRFIF